MKGERDRCARCGRFIGQGATEGWSGGLFGDFNGVFYCEYGVGCNKPSKDTDPIDVDAWFEVDHV